jgi:hypothetical protein
MRMDTMIKVGALAFGVAQDERVRELVTMMHRGAKRRGLLSSPILPPTANVGAPVAVGGKAHPPSSAAKSSPAPSTSGFAGGNKGASSSHGSAGSGAPLAGLNLSQYLNGRTARQALHVASQIGRLLVR